MAQLWKAVGGHYLPPGRMTACRAEPIRAEGERRWLTSKAQLWVYSREEEEEEDGEEHDEDKEEE